jgi:hypothetical protein
VHSDWFRSLQMYNKFFLHDVDPGTNATGTDLKHLMLNAAGTLTDAASTIYLRQHHAHHPGDLWQLPTSTTITSGVRSGPSIPHYHARCSNSETTST